MRRLTRRRIFLRWKKHGCQNPPPQAVKQMIVRQYGPHFNINIFVETGTYLGMMLQYNKGHFSRLYSIELDRRLYERVRHKFAQCNNIVLHHGDSATILPKLLGTISERCLFWLDAHCVESKTASAETNTPISTELDLILRDDRFDHVILIDDARAFVGVGGYPTLAQLESLVASRRKDWVFEVEHDIIRIHAPPNVNLVLH